MKLREIFGMKDESKSRLDGSLETLATLLEKRLQAKGEVEGAGVKLQLEMATKIASGSKTIDSKSFANVAERREALKAIESLIREARFEAIENIQLEKLKCPEEIKALNKSIAALDRENSLRLIAETVQFVERHKLPIEWPTKFNGGIIRFPLLPGVDAGEIQDIIAETLPEFTISPIDADLDRLRTELQNATALHLTEPNQCLSLLLSKKQAVFLANGSKNAGKPLK